MSIRTLFPNLLHAHPSPRPSSLQSTVRSARTRGYYTTPPPFPRSAGPPPPRAIAIPHVGTKSRINHLYTLGLGLTFLSLTSLRKPAQCESAYAAPTNASPYLSTGGDATAGGPPPESILNFYQLGFGTVAGICTGIFVKKGLKAIAFALGGMFVLLQVSDRDRMASTVTDMTIILSISG